MPVCVLVTTLHSCMYSSPPILLSLLQKYAAEELTLPQYSQLVAGELWGNFTGVLAGEQQQGERRGVLNHP